MSAPKIDDLSKALRVDLIGRLRIVIVYASLYGEEKVVDWSSER